MFGRHRRDARSNREVVKSLAPTQQHLSFGHALCWISMPTTSWAALPDEQGDEDSFDEESFKPSNTRKTLRGLGVGRTRNVSQDMEARRTVDRFTIADSESFSRPTRTTMRGEDATCWSRTQELWASVCERTSSISFMSFWNQHRDMGTAYRRRQVKASEQASVNTGGAVYEMDWRQTKTEAGQLAVVFPRELWKQVFDASVILATVYSVIALPFRIGFNAPAEGWLLVLELMISVASAAVPSVFMRVTVRSVPAPMYWAGSLSFSPGTV